jgi:H+/gluconate symporter-like permease
VLYWRESPEKREVIDMIFGLPPLLGLFPLLLYVILAFKKGMHPVVNVAICVVVGAVMVQQPILGMGSVIAKAMGSFLSLVGLIIMLGSGLGVVLRHTGVAENIVYFFMKKIGVDSENKAILATMITSVVLVALLGTLAGANAIIAPIVIPLVSAIGITPSVIAVIFQGAGQTGLFIGPFSPPMVTLMGITGLTYTQVLFSAGLPLSALMWVVTFFVAKRVQKKTFGVYSYSRDQLVIREDYKPSPQTQRGTVAFLGCMALLVGYGILNKGGASYAIMVMLITALVTGLVSGLSLGKVFDSLMEGCGKIIWLFFIFLLFDPFLGFVEKSGAFTALGELLKPYMETSGKLGFTVFSSLVGIFGISGAAVAQALMIDKLFRGLAEAMNVSMYMWALIVLVGHQLTSFAYPGADMIGEMGLAQSTDVKSMLKVGYAIIFTSMILVVVMTYVL